jgi:hypothetical protein
MRRELQVLLARRLIRAVDQAETGPVLCDGGKGECKEK